MKEYTIYCTAEQTRKALELGAPIEIHDTFDSYDIKESNIFYKDKFIELPDGRLIEHITAEQMMGWLREKDLYINIVHISAGYTSWVKTIKENITLSEGNNGFVNSFEEATIAGINEALKYL